MPKCCICGKEVDKFPYSGREVCSGECFHVDFWNRTLDDSAIIVNGNCYHDAGNKENPSKSVFLGHAGRVFTIRMKDSGRVFKTNNLWYNGQVPKERNIPDNAEFIRSASNQPDNI